MEPKQIEAVRNAWRGDVTIGKVCQQFPALSDEQVSAILLFGAQMSAEALAKKIPHIRIGMKSKQIKQILYS